jgi:polyisoprenoid-binding protein YceI
MEAQVRFVFDPKASQFTAHAFASGLAAVVAHNPKFAIREFSGEATFAVETLERATVKMKLKSNSLYLLDEVSEHDRTEIQRVTFEEVLDTRAFPDILFESSQVRANKISDNLYATAIQGNLTLRGVTRPHSFPAQVVVGDDSLRGYGDFTIRQTEYGIETASIAGGTLKMKDEVKIAFFIIGRKEG